MLMVDIAEVASHRLANIDWDLGYNNTTSLVPHENYTASVHRSYTSDSPQNTNCPCSISHNNYLGISRFDLNMTSTYHDDVAAEQLD